jgi:hypothetical protein
MKLIKIIIWIIVIAILIIQFLPVSYPKVVKENPNDLIRNSEISDEVIHILKTSCYDCHSNETRYPWYAYVAPVKWLVIRDVDLGRKDLNFSEWDNMKPRDKIKLLNAISEEIEGDNMPLLIYTITHRSASLDDEHKTLIIDWTEEMMNNILGE